MNQSIGQLMADASFQEGKWRAVRRVLEAIVPNYDDFSLEEQTEINQAVAAGDAKAIRAITKKHRTLEELSTHSIRERGRILQVKNWSRLPRFLLIKKIRETEATRKEQAID